jgi:tRNA(Ile)-lysidine synthase
MAAAPLILAELADSLAAIGGFEARPHLAVAVSGGPDSMALLLLAERWARRQGGCATALIVDHGLRPESAVEAAAVAGWLDCRGIARQILCWAGKKPGSGIQEAAREARYRLLAEWCRRNGVLHLLTAHHREDQVETHLMRRRAKSGIDGLAAMPAVREMPGCRLVRPLLAVPKARLKALLVAEAQPFVDDPSNDNPAFERARLRRTVDEGLSEQAQSELRGRGRRRVMREAALDRLLARAVSLHPAGFAMLDPAALAASEAELAERLLARVAACIGVARYPARRDRATRLRAGLLANPDRARTLGGCRFVPWRGRILVLRELAAAAPPMRLQSGASGVWDRRFFFAPAPCAAGGLTLGYLGQQGAAVMRPRADAMPRLLHPILPALWDAAGLAAVPHLGYQRHGLANLPTVSFCTANPLTRASFTVV